MIMPFPTEWKIIKVMFQTTNQYLCGNTFLIMATIITYQLVQTKYPSEKQRNSSRTNGTD